MSATQAAEFIPLGVLPGGDTSSFATGVSGDGSVVVGNSGGEPFRWTSAGGMVRLDPDGEFDSTVEGVSADGTVVVGWHRKANTNNLIEAFRWTAATGFEGLGDLSGGGHESEAAAVSADGSVVVGWAYSGPNRVEAFRWTRAGGMVGIGNLPGGRDRSRASGVTADGTVIVGYDETDLGLEAFRWTSATGMVLLGDLPGGNFDGRADDVSADGDVVVGNGSSASGTEAFRWTSAGGMVGLGHLPDHLPANDAESRAHGVSADGSVVVGQSQPDRNSGNAEPFVWTQANGMQSLRDVLVANGVSGLDDWELRNANSISADGQWVVGTGINPSGDSEAFLASLDLSAIDTDKVPVAITILLGEDEE